MFYCLTKQYFQVVRLDYLLKEKRFVGFVDLDEEFHLHVLHIMASCVPLQDSRATPIFGMHELIFKISIEPTRFTLYRDPKLRKP